MQNISTEADTLKKQMTGKNGALTKIGSSTDTLEASMKKAKTTTDEWAESVRTLFESFAPDNKKVQKAMRQLGQMEDQLKANQTATSALSTKYNDTNAQLQAKTADARNYKRALDFATGAKTIEGGSIVKLKKGTFVHYDRHGGVQQDDKGNTG